MPVDRLAGSWNTLFISAQDEDKQQVNNFEVVFTRMYVLRVHGMYLY